MNDKSKTRSVQLSDVLDRLERLESRIDSLSARGHGKVGDDDGPQQFCALPQVPERTFGSDVSQDRARLIMVLSKKWVNGTKLRYYFFESGAWSAGNDQKDIVREGFGAWEDLGIGIEFEEVQNIGDAEVRIGFLRGDGAWSYVGRDVIDIPGGNERTMNFGWDLRTDPRRVDVAIHEIGHTLGFPHEHQNPFAGIVWDEQAVYNYFGGPPNNWSSDKTFYNILRKLSSTEVQGSEWDPNSVMHYGFPSGLIIRPEQYHNGLSPAGGLSARDTELVRFFYPPLESTTFPELKPFQSESLELAPAEQKDFSIRPTQTRWYTIQTFGGSDTVVVLFEDRDGDLKYVQGDDDSGTERNARIEVRLESGRRYVLRIRLYLNYAGGETAVMLW